MPHPLKSLALLAVLLGGMLALVGRQVATPEKTTAPAALVSQSTAEEAFLEVIDLSTVFEPVRLPPLDAESDGDGELTPVRFEQSARPGFGKLWSAWRSGYDWGRAAVDR